MIVEVDKPFCPAPGTAHPDLEKYAESFREHLKNFHQRAMIMVRPDEGKIYDRVILTVKRFWGKAPYVGRPFVYFWEAAIDDDDVLWVAGETEIKYIPDELLIEYGLNPGEGRWEE